jgi:hypothetical protein
MKHERIFFAACSSECFKKIIQSGLRNPTGEIIQAVEPMKVAKIAVEQLFGN